MKRAIALLFLSFAFICVVFGSIRNGGVANAQSSSNNCPSPAPSCSSSGTLPHFTAGNYACSEVETDSTNTTTVGITLITSEGTGSLTVLAAKNNNSTSTTTFQDFKTSTEISYCVNTDDTGYAFSPADNGCPMAFIIDNGNGTAHSEIRLLDSTESTAKLVTCKIQ